MSNTPTDPSVSVSAAELRRRLLASTPLPAAAAEPAAGSDAGWNTGSNLDLLTRLRMPGGASGSVPVPLPRPAPAPDLSPAAVRP
ncbi:MAG: hypothetical protein K2X82_01520, partial [Gemmataceae bacterium]|nr:hypothetical protein [Gemmataceae bacterium]